MEPVSYFDRPHGLAPDPRRFRRTARPFAWALAAITFAGSMLGPQQAHAKVFYARDEMLSVAFPDADHVDAADYVLTHQQKAEIERRAESPLDSALLTVYTGRRAGQVVGYAILDTHIVRTLPETFLVVITPDGAIAATHVLAFYEPLEYLPGRRWLGQFGARRLSEGFRIGADIVAITGSTLSSRAVVAGVRRALAAYQVLIEECDSSLPENGPETDCSR